MMCLWKRDTFAHVYVCGSGASENIYYLTPHEFYNSQEEDVDPADTTQDFVYILDSSNTVRKTVASGTRIFLPFIPGVGTIRTR